MKKCLINIVLIAISILMTSCAMYHRLDGVEDYTELVLEKGDVVRIVLKDNSKMSFKVEKTDDKNIYAKRPGIVVNKKHIKSLEIKRGNGALDYLKISVFLAVGSMLSAP